MPKKIIDVLNDIPPGTLIEKRKKDWEISYLRKGTEDTHVVSATAVNLKTAVEDFLERLNHEQRKS